MIIQHLKHFIRGLNSISCQAVCYHRLLQLLSVLIWVIQLYTSRSGFEIWSFYCFVALKNKLHSWLLSRHPGIINRYWQITAVCNPAIESRRVASCYGNSYMGSFSHLGQCLMLTKQCFLSIDLNYPCYLFPWRQYYVILYLKVPSIQFDKVCPLALAFYRRPATDLSHM